VPLSKTDTDQQCRSPWWLLSKNKEQRARTSIEKLGYKSAAVDRRLAIIKLTLEESRSETDNTTYAQCFRGSNLRRTLISIAPLSIQAFCGVYFVLSYNVYYIQLSGYSTQESFQIGIAIQVCGIVGNVCSWFLIDRVGRRSLSLYGTGFITAMLCVIGGLAVAATPASIRGVVALFCLYNVFYNMTIGATAYSAITEIATAKLRVKTASIGLALQNALFVRSKLQYPGIVR